jgi:hypothetical protein
MDIQQVNVFTTIPEDTSTPIFQRVKNSIAELIGKLTQVFMRREKTIPIVGQEILARMRIRKLLDYNDGLQLDYLKKLIGDQFDSAKFRAKLLASMNMRNIVAYLAETVPYTFREGVLVQSKNANDQKILNEILDDNHFDNFCRDIDRYVYLCKTIFIKVDPSDSKKSKINLRLITPEYVNARTNEYDLTELEEISYPMFPLLDPSISAPRGTFCFWNEQNFYYTDESGKILPNPQNPDNINPYGIIPIVTFRERKKSTGEFFTWPSEELINAQDNLNVKLTFRNYLFKRFNIPLGVLIGNAMITNGQEINMDGSEVLVVRNEGLDSSTVSFDWKTPKTEMAAVMSVINEEIRAILISQGIDANLFVSSADRQSGTSIAAMNAKLEEHRAILKVSLQYSLEELMDVIRIVWNKNNPDNQMSDDKIEITIPNPKTFYQTAQDKWVDLTNKLKLNLITPTDILLMERNDLNNKIDAQIIIDENTAINKSQKISSILASLTNTSQLTTPSQSLTGA